MAQKNRLFDLPLIFASIFIAFVIWLMAEQGELTTDQLFVPVVLRNVPENVEMEQEPDRLPIIVNFPQSLRSQVVAQSFEIRLDVRELLGDDPRTWAGIDRFLEKSVDVTLDNVHDDLPQSISVSLDSTARVRLLAKLRTVKLPVKPVTQGNPPPGYEVVGPVRVEPAEVRVTAPFERLAEISSTTTEIATEPVDLTGRTSSFAVQPGLKVPAGLTLVNEEVARTVSVQVSINEREVTKTIREVPIEFLVFNEGLEARVQPATAEIKVAGKISAMDLVGADAFTFAWKGDLTEAAGQKGKVDLIVDLNENLSREIREKVRIEEWTPKSVEVEYVAAQPQSD